MAWRTTLAVVGSAGLACWAFAREATQDITVFVSAATDASGFVSPDATDSAKDLSDALRKKKGLRLVDRKERADVWIRIDRRFTRNRDSGGRLEVDVDNATATIRQRPVEEGVLVATLSVGDYSTEVTAAAAWTWKSIAGQLAKAVERWINENRERVLARRPKGE